MPARLRRFAIAAPLNLKNSTGRLHTKCLIGYSFVLLDGLLAGLAGLALCKICFTHLVSPQITLQPAWSLRFWIFAKG